jgi:hypothetical protein
MRIFKDKNKKYVGIEIADESAVSEMFDSIIRMALQNGADEAPVRSEDMYWLGELLRGLKPGDEEYATLCKTKDR